VGTTFGNDLVFTTLAQAPTAVTLAASDLTSGGARLNATVNPRGVPASVHFVYGPTTAYGTATDDQILGAGSVAVAVSATLTGLAPGSTVHFRVVATSIGGESTGDDGSFMVSMPSPLLLAPADGTVNVPLAARLTWHPCAGAVSYHVQVSLNGGFDSLVVDIKGIRDSSLQIALKRELTLHYWRVHGEHDSASSLWSTPVGRFTTGRLESTQDVPTGMPDAFALEQNFPNPFNPSTTIRFALPHRAFVSLTVFNALGQKVGDLLNGEVEAGYHHVRFDATGFPSGMYFYRIQAGEFRQIRRLLLLR
jgi:hypothetical protein